MNFKSVSYYRLETDTSRGGAALLQDFGVASSHMDSPKRDSLSGTETVYPVIQFMKYILSLHLFKALH